jgi:hypothetical protein
VGDGLVADLEILTKCIQGEQRAYPFWQRVGKLFDQGRIADRFEIADILPKEPFEAAPLPTPQRARRLRQERLRKAAVLEERPCMARQATSAQQILPPAPQARCSSAWRRRGKSQP